MDAIKRWPNFALKFSTLSTGYYILDVSIM